MSVRTGWEYYYHSSNLQDSGRSLPSTVSSSNLQYIEGQTRKAILLQVYRQVIFKKQYKFHSFL